MATLSAGRGSDSEGGKARSALVQRLRIFPLQLEDTQVINHLIVGDLGGLDVLAVYFLKRVEADNQRGCLPQCGDRD